MFYWHGCPSLYLTDNHFYIESMDGLETFFDMYWILFTDCINLLEM